MAAESQRARAEAALPSFESFTRAIPPALRPYLRSWTGYAESTPGVLRRRELPGPQAVMILEFGPPLAVFDSGSETRAHRYHGGFVAGLDDTFTLTEHDGFQTGIQLNLTPLGARALLQLPLHELSHRVVSLPDLVPSQRTLIEQLGSAVGWSTRFDIVERVIRARLAAAADPNAAVHWATQQIERTRGRIDIAGLAAELGYSRKHLVSLFHEHVGLAPKRYANLVRFDELTARLRASPSPAWTELAFDLGYADQAHLAREVRRFSGLTPTQVRALVAAAPIYDGAPDCHGT